MSILELDSGFFSTFKGPSAECNLYHEDLQNKNNLLITIGDSWTWGDSIGTTKYAQGISDKNRTNLIYGKHLQCLITDCDWINIAMPGTANQWIVDSALRFPNLISKLNYKKIYLIIGLTDITRDHAQRGYHPESNNYFLKSLELWERDYFEKLSQLSNLKNVITLVGRNFTNTFENNIKILSFHLNKRWIDISADAWDNMIIPGPTVGMNIPTHGLSAEEKLWASNTGIPESMQVISFLNKCPLHYKKASKHPTEESHRLWANYIFSNLGVS